MQLFRQNILKNCCGNPFRECLTSVSFFEEMILFPAAE